MHEALQRLVGGSAALGVIPMGTANALAADLGLPPNPVKAVRMLLTATPMRVSVGHVFYRDSEGRPGSRYFIVAAGIGADALFFSPARLEAEAAFRLRAIPGGGVSHLGDAYFSSV